MHAAGGNRDAFLAGEGSNVCSNVRARDMYKAMAAIRLDLSDVQPSARERAAAIVLAAEPLAFRP
jgi:hypothetical protein